MFQPFYHPLRQALLNDGSKMGGIESAIKSFQSFGGSFLEDETQHDYPINEIDLDFAVIFDTGFSTNWNSTRAFTRKVFLNSTTIRAVAGASVTTFTLTIRFFVVEFEHFFIKSLQHITPVLADGVSLADITISEVDVNKAQIIPAGLWVANDTYSVNGYNLQLRLSSPTNLKIARAVGNGRPALNLSLFVLEFK